MQPLVANTQVCWWAGAGPDEFDGFFGVDPLGAVQGGCRRTRDDGTSARPQPGGDGAIPQREFSVPGGVDVGQQAPIPAELVAGEDAGLQGFAADENSAHARMMAGVTDNGGRRRRDCGHAAEIGLGHA
jgi:hypothetical protein